MLINENSCDLFFVNLWKLNFKILDSRLMKQFKYFLPVKSVFFRKIHHLFFNSFEYENRLLEFLDNLQCSFLSYSRDSSWVVICSDQDAQAYKLIKIYFKQIQNLAQFYHLRFDFNISCKCFSSSCKRKISYEVRCSKKQAVII